MGIHRVKNLFATIRTMSTSAYSELGSTSTSIATPSPSPASVGRLLPFSLGTYRLKGDACRRVIAHGLRIGYRRIDTATVYRNEIDVGVGMLESGIKRSEIYVTSKLSPAQMESETTAYDAVEQSRTKLGLDSLDCYLVHWPGRGGWHPPDERHRHHRLLTWRGLERAQLDGLTKTIGVSNFEIRHLEQLKSEWKFKPCVNQFELHPFIYQTQLPLIRWCRENGIAIQAYAPLGSPGTAASPDLITNEVVLSISRECGRSAAVVLLRWSHQHGFEVLPKTSNLERLEENATAAADDDWSLTPEQMERLDQLETTHGTKRFCWDPSTIA